MTMEELKAVRRDGYRAYMDGESYGDNPYDYDADPMAHEAWSEGYNDAAWDD